MDKKIGILGGTFSPIHKAHIEIANKALSQFHLDEIWLLVAGLPPHKDLDDDVNAFLRLEMCKIATKEYKNIIVKDIECYKYKKSYTYITLQRLKELHPDYEYYFIMGEDSIDTFSSWVNPQVIASLTNFIVAVRDSDNLEVIKNKALNFSKNYKSKCEILALNHIPVSSTLIRDSIRNNNFDFCKKYINQDVLDYIKTHSIYKKQFDYDVDSAIELIKNTQKDSRYKHCMRVADTAASLAAAHLYPTKIAYITGILHDCAKHMSGEELISFCHDNSLSITQAELEAPYLLHGLVGSKIAKRLYNIDDEMVHAIEVHTRGCENMSLLDKIIFIADFIEPGRKRSRVLEAARIMSFKDIDSAIIMILEDTIDYLKMGNRPVDETTSNTLNYYYKLVGERHEYI